MQLGREDMVCTLDEAKQGRELLVSSLMNPGVLFTGLLEQEVILRS